ncbi:MAG TPA: hypothetical protein VFI97_05490 [Arthrobacter sp.]|nr:hypothetical protein [Arthrobacter sp.]
MINKRGPDLLPVNLTIKSQGETLKFPVTYYNRTPDEIQAEIKREGGNVITFVIKEWELPFDLAEAGLKEMEECRPGMLEAIMTAYHEARGSELVKN